MSNPYTKIVENQEKSPRKTLSLNLYVIIKKPTTFISILVNSISNCRGSSSEKRELAFQCQYNALSTSIFLFHRQLDSKNCLTLNQNPSA